MMRYRWYSHDNAMRRTATGELKPVGRNYAVPRTATLAQHAHTAYEAIVFQTLRRHSHPLMGHGNKPLGEVCLMSERQIAAECLYPDGSKGMPLASARKVLRTLIRKHSVVQWDVNKSRPQPRRRGDHGGITAWRIPTYDEILAARRADPAIAKIGKKMFVIGRGRRFLTPEELETWKIDEKAVDKAGVRAMPSPVTIEIEQEQQQQQPSPAAPRTASRGPTRAEPPPPHQGIEPEDVEPVRVLLAQVCAAGAGDADARHVVGNARRINADIPIAGIAQVIDTVVRIRRKTAGNYTFTAGFFSDRVLDGPVRDWIEKQRKFKREEARRAKWDRDARVNSLVQFMAWLREPEAAMSDNAIGPQDLAQFRVWIESAAPDERAEAEALLTRVDANWSKAAS